MAQSKIKKGRTFTRLLTFAVDDRINEGINRYWARTKNHAKPGEAITHATILRGLLRKGIEQSDREARTPGRRA